tara:strand:- start:5329 stop:7368 length:2040 start_codon:yes stop_codon:yes gene_type:complete
MAGISGHFDDEEDFILFRNGIWNLTTNYRSDNWANENMFDTIADSMDMIQSAMEKLAKRGFKSHCTGSYKINDRIMDYAKNRKKFDWGWWRQANSKIDLLHDDKVTWIGNDSPYLSRTVLHYGAGIIKHNYTAVPEPVELSVSEFKQEGVVAYMGVENAGVLDSICSVPWMQADMLSKDFANKMLNNQMDINKWQRVIDHRRVDTIRNFAEQEDKNLFNPVLLYVDEKYVNIITDKNNKKRIDVPFDFLEKIYGVWTDYFPLPEQRDSRPVWIIDGQHRIRGFGSSKRGSRMPIPYVLIVGDGSPKTVANIALLFTQINTKSEPLDDLHKIYLNYQFGIKTPSADFTKKVDKTGTEIIGVGGLPEPTKSGRASRRSFELSLYLAAHSESPILDCVQFQKPPGKNTHPKNVTDTKKFLANTTSWFSNGIYKDSKLDEICNEEVLNFFRAYKSQCTSWPDGQTRWHVGKSQNKSFLQNKGPFPSLLATHEFCVEKIINDDPKIERPIKIDVFTKVLEPIQWVDWNSPSLRNSALSGSKNDNVKHINLWIQTAITNGVSHPSNETLNLELTSTPGKGLLALPKVNQPEKTPESSDFPTLKALVLEVEKPYHCLRIKWEAEVGAGKEFRDIAINSKDIKNKDNKSRVTFGQNYVAGHKVLKVRAVFVNGIGSSHSEWRVYKRV